MLPMLRSLAKRWWLLALRGFAAVLFGVLTFVAPLKSLFALVLLFGVWAIVDGAFNLGSAIRGPRERGSRWGFLIVGGVLGIAAGLVTLAWPAISALVLLYVIAAWAVSTGVIEVAAAIRLRQQLEGEWMLGVAGALSIAFGLLLFVFPGAGALAVVLWIGAYAIVFGALMLGLAFKLRGWSRGTRPQLPGGMEVPA